MIHVEENPEQIADIIYSELDSSGHNQIPVYSVIKYIQEHTKNPDVSTILSDLQNMLSEHEREYIGRSELVSIMKTWTERVQEDSMHIRTLESSRETDNELDELVEEEHCLNGFLLHNVSTHSTGSQDSSSVRDHNELIERLSEVTRQKNYLEQQYSTLQTLFKDQEETISSLTAENVTYKKTSSIHEKKLESLQTLQKDYVELSVALQNSKAQGQTLQIKLKQSEKNYSILERQLVKLVEEKDQMVAKVEAAENKLTECLQENLELKQELNDLESDYNSQKTLELERMHELECTLEELRRENQQLKSSKSEMELTPNVFHEECSTNKHCLEESEWSDRILTSSEVSEDQCGWCTIEDSNKVDKHTLHAELKASGGICDNHRNMEEHVMELQQKFDICKNDLAEYQESENSFIKIIEAITASMKLFQSSLNSSKCSGLVGEVANIKGLVSGSKLTQASSQKLMVLIDGIVEEQQLFVDCLIEKSSIHKHRSSQTDCKEAINSESQTIIFTSSKGTQTGLQQQINPDINIPALQISEGKEPENYHISSENEEEAVTVVTQVENNEMHHQLLENNVLVRFTKDATERKLTNSRNKRKENLNQICQSSWLAVRPHHVLWLPFNSLFLESIKRACRWIVFMFFIIVLFYVSLSLLVQNCFGNDLPCTPLCAFVQELLRPYMRLRHQSPPPT